MKLTNGAKLSILMVAILLAACGDNAMQTQEAQAKASQIDQETEQLIAGFHRVSEADPNCKVPDLPYTQIYCMYEFGKIIPGIYKAIEYGVNNEEETIRYDLINAIVEVIADLKEYQEIDWNTSHGLTAVMIDGKVGYIDLTGKLVIPAEYDSIKDLENKYSELWAYNASEYGIVVKKGDKYGVINRDNQVVIPFDFDEMTEFSKEGVAIYHQYDSAEQNVVAWGMINHQGKMVDLSHYDGTEGSYIGIDGVNEGLLAVHQGELWGFVDMAGNEVIPLQYQEVRRFSEGVAGVMKDGFWGFIDKTGNVVIDFDFPDANVPRYSVNMMGKTLFIFNSGSAEVSTHEYEVTQCINHESQVVSCESEY